MLLSAAKITVKADSLERELALNAQFFSAIESVLRGDPNQTAQSILDDTLTQNDLGAAQIVWYEYLERPAYKNLTKDQVQRAVKLCEDIFDGNLDAQKLDQQSLIWPDKHRQA